MIHFTSKDLSVEIVNATGSAAFYILSVLFLSADEYIPALKTFSETFDLFLNGSNRVQ